MQITAIRGVNADPAIEPVLRFGCGRLVEMCRSRRVFALGTSADELVLLLDGLWQAFGPQTGASADLGVADEAKRLHSVLPVGLRRRVGELIAEVPRSSIDPHAYIASCNRAADRSGLLACGNAAAALEAHPDAAAHLTRFAASRGYRNARRALRTRR
ncbi:MAG TPA: hypothetical protein VKE22_28415 [Haliangiales bacterium]|nr:hypothetical protein [Haliangiales bacterium]